MKLMIVRHAEPDYSIDSITPKGKTEAALLAQRLSKLDVKAFYVSPLGRAQDTAAYTLKVMNRTATTCEWLREFSPEIHFPGKNDTICWDWLPKDWTPEDRFYGLDSWADVDCMKHADAGAEYRRVNAELDQLLAQHGYVRKGRYYQAVQPNKDTIVLFCHFGLECVLLSHLLGISPMLLWHGFCAAPSSVTTLTTEERSDGIAYFRTSFFGDVSHLYAAGEEPSFAARFCEVHADFDPERD